MTPTTSNQQSVVRLAIALMAANPAAPLSALERERLTQRLQVVTLEGQCVAFTPRELAELKQTLMTYITAHHPRIAAIVHKSFAPSEEVA